MRFISRSIVLISAVTILSGCSDSGSSSSSSLVSIEGWVGAQGFDNAQVVVNQIAESGQVSVSSNDVYLGLRKSTDSSGKFTADVASDETILFIARGQVADVDEDQDNLATTRQCQVANGCTVSDIHYSFGNYYPATTGYEWRSVVYTQEKGSKNNVNPITTLASAYGYEYLVETAYDDSVQAIANQAFTPFDVVLANSQVAGLFGLSDIIGVTPANLTKLNNYTDQKQIRYGALIAALQSLEFEYNQNKIPTDDDFMSVLVEQFVADKGQMFYQDAAGNARALVLAKLYTAAHENLTALASKVTNTEAKAAVNATINRLKTEASEASDKGVTAKTSAVPDDLSLLLSTTEISDISVGLEKTKLFVASLLEYQDTFWQEGYKTELDDYVDLLKTVGDKNKDNLNELVAEFALVQNYYLNIQNDSVNCSANCIADASEPELISLENRYDIRSYNETSKTLTLSGIGGNLTVSEKIADLNLYDSITESTSSQAIDVFITGTISLGDLVLNLEHDMDTDEESIDVPSSMRLYFTDAVTSIQSALNENLEVSGYEVIWGDFELYDDSVQADPTATTTSEIELEGSFRIFYRGVQDPQKEDPQNENTPNDSELRFNIEELVLTSTISDNIDDEVGSDGETTTVVITASASNASDYYPSKKFASFNGFFETDETLASETLNSLLSYQLGTENVQIGSRTVTVETADFINDKGTDIRYRFYPTEQVQDDYDSDGDGEYFETVDMHYLEECELDEIDNTVVTCGSKARIYEKRDRQNTLNELWKLGVIQSIDVSGRGTYWVDLPATKNTQGCYELDDLSAGGPATLSGTLLEPLVLGLDSVRFYAQVNLQDANGDSLPSTLLDMLVVAPTKDKYQIDAILSHNYSSTETDSSGLILGSGSYASILTMSYDTSFDFKDMGNISISKGGVDLTLEDGSAVTEDQDITAFLTQSYDSDSMNYKIVEAEDGSSERCVLSTDSRYTKDLASLEDSVFYLNYRDVLYGTAREENGVWVIRYLDGSWFIPATNTEGTKDKLATAP